MRRLVCVAMLALAACGAPEGEVSGPGSGAPADDSNIFRADSINERPYAGEWASDPDACRDERKVWTIESNRLGMRRERFCVFGQIRVSRATKDVEAWRADARCVSAGQQSEDVLFFRVKTSGLSMRVTINDADAIDLVRCPMRT